MFLLMVVTGVFSYSSILSNCMSFLVGLHILHEAQRRIGEWVSFHRLPTLSNQLLPHLLADILQTLHSCYRHIEDVHVNFWE
jgi:hypothetical protein